MGYLPCLVSHDTEPRRSTISFVVILKAAGIKCNMVRKYGY